MAVAAKSCVVKSVIVGSTRSYQPPADPRCKILASQAEPPSSRRSSDSAVDTYRLSYKTTTTAHAGKISTLTPTAAATQISAQDQLVQSADDGKYYLRSKQYTVKRASDAGGLPNAALTSTLAAPALHTNGSKAVGSSKGIRFETLQMSSSMFDPSLSAMRSQILKHLGLSHSASIQELENPGGCNKGIWTVKDGDQNLVMKLINNKRKYPHVPTDTEKCVQLIRKHVDIGSDSSLTFPLMIFRCCEPGGEEVYDLSVMHGASGLRLADVIAIYYRTQQGRLDDLVEIFHKFGTFLARFHAAYQMQHGDCHASNVFYDESSNFFTLIDVADMSPTPYASDDDDVTYFNGALLTLSEYYGSNLLTKCGLKMRAGYKEGLNSLTASAPILRVNTPPLTPPRAEARRQTAPSRLIGSLKPSGFSKGLRVESLQMSSTTFDPTMSFTKSQILMHLDCSPSASIEEFPNPGGCNKGIWILTDSNMNLVLKLIDSKRKYPTVPTDTEKCLSLVRNHPNIGNDNSLAFPFMVFKCCEPGGNEIYDLSVMREAPGLRLADVIAIYYRTKQDCIENLVDIFRSFGTFLAAFHHTYQMQHGDCHASNVFYDEGSNQFTIIDVADVGATPYGNEEDDDITYFNRALLTLGQYYTTDLMTRCGQSLVNGYKEQMDSSPKLVPKQPSPAGYSKLTNAPAPPAFFSPAKRTGSCSTLLKLEVDRQSVGMSGPIRNTTPSTPPSVKMESASSYPTRVSITTKPVEITRASLNGGYKPVENPKAKISEYKPGQDVEVLRSSGLWTRGKVTTVEPLQLTVEFKDESHKSIPTASLQQLLRAPADDTISREVDELKGQQEDLMEVAEDFAEKDDLATSRQAADAANEAVREAEDLKALSIDSKPVQNVKSAGIESSSALSIETLHMSNGTFDPIASATEILSHLDAPGASIQEMPNPGGGNKGIKGIWLVTDAKQSFTLKLISSKRKYPSIPTVTEKCVTLASKRPNIKNDLSVSFPFMIFKCCDSDENEAYDLLVMREAPGYRLADIIAYRNSQGRLDNLVDVFRKFGKFLAGFHALYQMQHGHCHPSNVFYDESTNQFTLTDVANMEANPYASDDDDVTYFNRALMTLKEYYGSSLIVRCSVSVVAGFKEPRRII